MDSQAVTCKSINQSTTVINPGRQLDNSNAHEMLEAISAAQSGGYRFIIIDMSSLEFISSAGVGSILGSVVVAPLAECKNI